MTGPVLFLIPARGGSKRVPGKNLAAVGGTPLVARAIRAARLAAEATQGGPHRVVCSTDSQDIADVASRWGAEVPFLRSPELATDTASAAAAAVDALDRLAAPGGNWAPRAVVLVQPTSPFVRAADLVLAIARFDATGRPTVAVSAGHPASWHLRREPAPGDDSIATSGSASRTGAARRLTGASADAADLLLTGAFYVQAPERLRRGAGWSEGGPLEVVEVPPETAVDVDEPSHLAFADALARRRVAEPIDIGGRRIGPGLPVFVIAEAGVNHNGDLDIAHRLVDAAADAGADAVKFQTFDADHLAAPAAGLAAYQTEVGIGAASQREMLRALQLGRDAHVALQRHAAERGILFFSSPFDDPSIELLASIDVPIFKIASGELTNLPILRRIAAFGRPMLVSTGMADLVEVADALEAIRLAGDPPVALLHCVSSYPARPEDANLRAISTLEAAFGLPVGWSDHTEGAITTLAAIALGATLVEKHLTLDRSMAGPDHRASMEPSAFAGMVAAIRLVSVSLGDGVKRPVPGELTMREIARKSLHWARDLEAGATVVTTDLVAMRPGSGLEPRRADELHGRILGRHVAAGAPVTAEDFG